MGGFGTEEGDRGAFRLSQAYTHVMVNKTLRAKCLRLWSEGGEPDADRVRFV